MKIYDDINQRTLEWFQVKAGKFSASEAGILVTGTGKISTAQAVDDLIMRKAGEVLSGEIQDTGTTSFAMRRGMEMEPEAFDYHIMSTGIAHKYVGWVEDDGGAWGVSPDAMLENGELMELKCPLRHTHIGYAIDPPSFIKRYNAQIQMQMFVCEAERCDLMSYDPKLPPVLLQVRSDEKYIGTLKQALEQATEKRDAIVEKLRSEGW